jgi:hypothetical protein
MQNRNQNSLYCGLHKNNKKSDNIWIFGTMHTQKSDPDFCHFCVAHNAKHNTNLLATGITVHSVDTVGCMGANALSTCDGKK